MKEKNYSVFHGIGGDDVRVVVADVGGEAVGEEADADGPFDEDMTAALASPNPTQPHSRFAMPLLQRKSIYFLRRHGKTLFFLG